MSSHNENDKKITSNNKNETLSEIEKEFNNYKSNETQQIIREKALELLDTKLITVKKEVIKEIKKILSKKGISEEKAEEEFQRFNLNFRIQHIVLFVSCIILIITGIPIKYHESALAIFIMNLMGGIKVSGFIHRIGAAGLIGVGIVHLFYTVFTKDGRKDFIYFLPCIKDVKDVYIMVKYYLGFSNKKAKFDRFSYVEKFDYWAVYWGMVIMIGSGSILWFENIVLRVFPKYIYDISKVTHSDEALLATLAIIIWHFYNVHFNPDKFPMSYLWLTGKISKQKMMEEHPLEYEKMIKEKSKKENN